MVSNPNKYILQTKRSFLVCSILFIAAIIFFQFAASHVYAASDLPVRGCIDNPKEQSSVDGIINVYGWVLDTKGVSKVEVFVDNISVGEAVYGLPRPDVYNTFPDYEISDAGFSYNLDTYGLYAGTHVIGVKETSKDGVITEIKSCTIQVIKLPVKGCIDNPKEQSSVDGIINVYGWVLDAKGVSKVEVFVDDVSVGEAVYGLPRPDVYNTFPDYEISDAGFSYNLDTHGLYAGTHVIGVKETSKDGVITEIKSCTIQVVKLPVKGCIDNPKEQSSVNGIINVYGWVLDTKGVSKVEVFVDDISVGEAVYGLPRPDVYNTFPDYEISDAGFSFNLDTRSLYTGTHVIGVRETSKDGVITEIKSRTVQVAKLPVKGWIDSPKDKVSVSGIVSVKGWFIDNSGVSKIEVLVDDVNVGEAVYGLPRPDVYDHFSEYKIRNTGFRFDLDTGKLSQGEHVIKVKETGNDGKVTELDSRTISVVHLSQDDFIFDVKTGTIQKYKGKGGNVIIPDMINGVYVTAIGDSAFHSCYGLTGIKIPEGVKSIGQVAFACCSELTSINIPKDVSCIKMGVFANCSKLTNVKLPEGVTSIEYSAFFACRGITGIEIPQSVTSIGDSAFSCSGLTGIKIPNGVTVIQNSVFRGCSALTNVTIPESVISIYSDAFSECTKLTGIKIPQGVTEIGAYAFSNSGLTRITLPNGVTSIWNGMFAGCSNLTAVTLPDGLTSIGDAAFTECIRMTIIKIPDSVSRIGIGAFSRSGLTGITLPRNLAYIGGSAFEECHGLTSVTIPASVTSIGEYAFLGCSKLHRAIFDGSQPKLFGTLVFGRTATDFKIIVYSYATGFGKPGNAARTWVWTADSKSTYNVQVSPTVTWHY